MEVGFLVCWLLNTQVANLAAVQSLLDRIRLSSKRTELVES